MLFTVEIPANTTATVYVPVQGENEIMENGMPLTASKTIQVVGKEKGNTIVKLGSGKYEFTTAFVSK